MLRIASATRTAVVPQGARTGLAGGANAVDGCIVLSTAAMDRILEIDPVNRLAVVQPGVVNADDLPRGGRARPALPARPELVGVVHDRRQRGDQRRRHVLREVRRHRRVRARPGGRPRRRRDTPMWTAHAQGRRRLRPDPALRRLRGHARRHHRDHPRAAARPDASLTLAALFDSMPAAGAAVTAIAESGATPSLLELLDRVHLRAIEALRPMGLPTSAAALLLAAVDSGAGAPADLDAMADVCRRPARSRCTSRPTRPRPTPCWPRGACPIRRWSSSPPRPSPPAPARSSSTTWPCPCPGWPSCWPASSRYRRRRTSVIGVVGHAGDGNMHPNIVVDRADPSSMERGRRRSTRSWRSAWPWAAPAPASTASAC